MSEKNFGYLGTSFQQGLLKTIIEDKEFAVIIIDVIKSSYFDPPYFKYIMENIKELYEKYKTIPTYDTLQQKVVAENPGGSARVHVDTLLGIKNLILQDNRYIKDVSIKFCRQQVVKKAIKEADEIIQKGEFENYDKIENIITSALQVGATTEGIFDIGENIRESLQKDDRVPFPTGIDGLDSLLKGGLARGEFGIILAPTGIGKTTILTKFANSAFNCGANVLHIFFEDHLNIIRKKHYTIWTGIAPDDQREHEDEVVEIVTNHTKSKKNRLHLLKLPSFGITISDIKSKIRKMESEGKKIDLLVLDYIDLISSERTIEGEEWKGEGTITRALEGMCDEFNIAMWSATQGNRDSIGAEVVTTDQMGGSIKKAQVGHVVISVAKTLQQKEHKLANITLLKSRIGQDGIIFSNCKFDNEYLIFDTESQNTLLGHAEDRAEERIQHAADVYRQDQERKMKIRKEIEDKSSRLLLESAVSKAFGEKEEIKEELNQLHNFEEEKIRVDINDFVVNSTETTNDAIIEEELVEVTATVEIPIKDGDDDIIRKRADDRNRAAEVYKNARKKLNTS